MEGEWMRDAQQQVLGARQAFAYGNGATLQTSTQPIFRLTVLLGQLEPRMCIAQLKRERAVAMASERVRPSQRFQRLLDQLSQCHEEETCEGFLGCDCLCRQRRALRS